jgi:hypothetical protein
MAKGRSGTRRIRHNSRSWVLKALQSSGSSAGMLTKEIQKKASDLSGKKIPPYSLYQALRTLVKRKVVSATRKGRQFSYRLLGTASSAPATRRAKASVSEPASSPAMVEGTMAVVAAPANAMLPHKLAPGELTILVIEEQHIETATNEHGKLVLQRHPRPR